MLKISKKLGIIFVALMAFMLLEMCFQKVMALSVGQTVHLTANSEYTMNQDNLASKTSNYFCIQEGQPLNHNTAYKVKKHAKITGDNEVDYVMCWIAAQQNADSTPEDTSNPRYSKKQKNIYAYYGTWSKKHGWNAGYGAPNKYKNNDWVNKAKEKYKEWVNAKNTYIKNNKPDVDSLNKELYSYNGQTYIKVGPFNFSYGTYNKLSFTVTNQNGTKISPLYGKYDGNTFKVYSSASSVQQSGKDFYILVNTNTNATKISLEINLSANRWDYTGDVYLLQSSKKTNGKTMQNVINIKGYIDKNEKTTVELEMKDIILTGDLEITKQDQNTGALLNNVGFVLFNTDRKQYVASVSSNGIATYTSNRNQAREFVTGVDGSNGKITIKGLVVGNYDIYETKSPNEGYEDITGDKKVATVKVTSSNSSSSGGINDNKRTLEDGFYEIQSALNSNMVVDMSGGKPIDKANIQLYRRNNSVAQQFYVEYLGNGYYVIRAASAVNKVLDVEDGSTASGANVQVYRYNNTDAQKWMIRDAGNGYYYIVNKGGGKYLDVAGGETANNTNIQVYNGNNTDSQKFKFNKKGNSSTGTGSKVTITNQRKYIKISGYVWEDIAWDDGKNQNSNQLYQDINDDKNDKLLNNIVVRLKDSSGNTIKETRTNSNGKYTFTDVLIENLNKYYIEFSYNGMAYESVDIINISNNRGTKAIEGNNRTSFNEGFAQITTGQSNNSSGTKTNDIRYNTGNYRSTINYEGTYQYGYDPSQAMYMTADEYRAYYPVNGVASKYLITSSTYNAYKSVGRSGYLSDIINVNDLLQNGITEIGTTFTSGINLGLKKRERPDLSVVKDIESAKVSVVGVQHVYKYGDRFNPDLWTENSNGVSGHELDPKVKFEEKYAEMSYSRALYASDVYYAGDQGDPLAVELTYKIGVRNNSTNLNANIYELDDYFDSKYNLIAIGTDINADGSIKSGTEITNYTSPTNVNSEYKKMTIGGNNSVLLELGPLEEKYVYVQLQVNKNDIIQIVENSNSENSKLDNITEIKKYGITRTNKNGVKDVYAGIDKDSQPGNTDINNRATWEDDTDKAPGMLLELQQAREVNGKVFLDTDENPVNDGEQVHTGIARQGNGQYDDDEKGIENVKVTLIDEEGNIAQVYNETSRQYEDAVTYTDENGEYTLGGFIPGEYEVQYTWGGNVDGAGLNSTYTLDSGEEEVVNVQNYKSTVVNEEVWNAKETAEKWYNEYFKRSYPGLEWNTDTNTEIRASDAVDDYNTRLAIDSETGEVTYGEKQKLENTYDSTSTEEKYTNIQMNSNTQNFTIYLEYNDTTNVEDNITEHSEESVNRINSVDFGIIERARQVLKLDKHITAARITLADGNTLVNARLKDGQLVDEAQYVSVTPDSPGANGMVRIEVDQELIQSATVEIEYGLEITNISEVEYQTEEFYMYGVGNGEDGSKLVTLQPGLIIDYLDNNLATDMSENAVWDSIAQENRKAELIDTGLLSESLKDILTGTSRVITTDDAADQVLVPQGVEIAGMNNTSSIEVALSGYKLLSSNGDETFLENNAEIIKVIKNNGGGTLITTPGDYNPTDLSTSELDDSTSESLVILPPTGLTTNYIAYILLAISSLGIIVAGIILIKKFVLK